MNRQQKGWETRRRRQAEQLAQAKRNAEQIVREYDALQTAAGAIAADRFIAAPGKQIAGARWSGVVLLLAIAITGAVIMLGVGHG